MNFWRFNPADPTQYFLLSGEYNFVLVWLSILISILTSFTFLIVLNRTWQTRSCSVIKLWRMFGCIIFGLGVWAMHFTAMLAFLLPVQMSFNIVITMLSVIPPMIGAFYSLKILTSQRFSFFDIQVSALCIALGIGFMHFMGMEAMQFEAKLVYDPWLFFASIGSAHILAVLANIFVAITYRTKKKQLLTKLVSASFMGFAIASMHFIAMASASFHVADGTLLVDDHNHEHVLTLALSITAIVFIIVITTILSSLLDHRLQATELMLQESVTRQRDIVEHLADGLIIIDQEGNIDSVNSMGNKMFKYESATLEGRGISTLMPNVALSELLNQCLSNPERSQTRVTEGIKRNGQHFPIEVSCSTMSTSIDRLHFFNCVIRDISQRVQLEQKLRQAQKLESIGQLAAGIAHEINTPTQYVSDNTSFIKNAAQTCVSIVTASKEAIEANDEQTKQQKLALVQQLIEDGDIDFITEEIPLAIDQSMEGLQRITKIVGAMKSFSHSSDNSMQQVDIAEAIESTVIVARSEWRYVAQLTLSTDKTLPMVSCLRDEINQVILNCIVNSAHAIAERFEASDDKLGLINISTSQHNDNIVISIKDNGCGMSPAVQKRIFDPFFTTKGVGKGTGQGLSLAYNVIVETHKGQIKVDSTEGEGTTLHIYLPISPTEQEENKHESAIR